MTNLDKLLESKEAIGDIVHRGLSEASGILADAPKTETVMAVVMQLDDVVIHVAVSRRDASFIGSPKKNNLRVLK